MASGAVQGTFLTERKRPARRQSVEKSREIQGKSKEIGAGAGQKHSDARGLDGGIVHQRRATLARRWASKG